VPGCYTVTGVNWRQELASEVASGLIAGDLFLLDGWVASVDCLYRVRIA